MCGQADDPSQHDRPTVVLVERCSTCSRLTDPDTAITVDFGGTKGLGAVCAVCQDREDRGFAEDEDFSDGERD